MEDFSKAINQIRLDLEDVVDQHYKTWFAIQQEDDNEAMFGSNNLEEAVKMAIDEVLENGYARVALFYDNTDECYSELDYTQSDIMDMMRG